MPKLLIAISLLLLQSVAAQMFPFPGPKNASTAIATKGIVQGCGNGNGGVTSISCTFGSAITAGHTLYFCVGQYQNTGNLTWSGDSGTFTIDPGNSLSILSVKWQTGGSFGYYVSCVYVLSAGGGTTTITASGIVSAGNAEIAGAELYGITSFDKSDNGSAQNSIGLSLSSLSITPTANSAFLLGVCMNYFAYTISPGTNVAWALVPNASPQIDPPWTALESYLQSTATSVSAQCSIGTSAYWWAHIVAFH